MSTVDDFISRLEMYLAGSRTPEQEARSLWVCEHSREQVCMEQRGQRYFGGDV